MNPYRATILATIATFLVLSQLALGQSQVILAPNVCSNVASKSNQEIHKSYKAFAKNHLFWPDTSVIVALSEATLLGNIPNEVALRNYETIYRKNRRALMTPESADRTIRTVTYTNRSATEIDQQLEELKSLKAFYVPGDTLGIIIQTANLSNMSVSKVYKIFTEYFKIRRFWARNESPARLAQIGILFDRKPSEMMEIVNKMASFQRIWSPSDSIVELAIASVLSGKSAEEVYRVYRSFYSLQKFWNPSESISELTKTTVVAGIAPERTYEMLKQVYSQFRVLNPDIVVGDLIRTALFTGKSTEMVLNDFRQIVGSQFSWGQISDAGGLTRIGQLLSLDSKSCRTAVTNFLLMEPATIRTWDDSDTGFVTTF